MFSRLKNLYLFNLLGAIHAMTDLYDEFSSDGWGFLLVDAVNAFNLMSRVTALWNARILWPRCSRFLFNTYRGFAVLLLRNSEEFLYSREGVTQGDPLSMLLYAVAMMPLVNSLRCRKQYQQSWYADDSACAGPLYSIHSWLDRLIERGRLNRTRTDSGERLLFDGASVSMTLKSKSASA